MTDRPILFASPMVRALHDGRKTQTRRILKPQPGICDHLNPGPWHIEESFAYCGTCGNGVDLDRKYRGVPIRFAVGDRLWVRETCRGEELDNGQDVVRYAADNAFLPIENSVDGGVRWLKLHTYRKHSGHSIGPWVNSIHMPRWASRLTLVVTDVRVERLQDISEADAIAEGVERRTVPCCDGVSRALWFGVPHVGNERPAAAYADLWDSINNPRGLCAEDAPNGWASNPWVRAISFTDHSGNIDQVSP